MFRIRSKENDYKEHIDNAGKVCSEVLQTYSSNSAATILILWDIISNNFNEVYILDAIAEIKEILMATNFLDVLKIPLTSSFYEKLKEDRYLKLEVDFFQYYFSLLPVLVGYKIIKDGEFKIRDKELLEIQKICYINFYNKYSKLIDDELLNIDQYRYIFFEEVLPLYGWWVIKWQRQNGLKKIINDSRIIISSVHNNYPEMHDEKNTFYFLKQVINEHFSLFWDSLYNLFTESTRKIIYRPIRFGIIKRK